MVSFSRILPNFFVLAQNHIQSVWNSKWKMVFHGTLFVKNVKEKVKLAVLCEISGGTNGPAPL